MASPGSTPEFECVVALEFLAANQPIPGSSPEQLILKLFTEMRAPVFRHLLWLHLRPDQAEDVIQETFLRLYQHLSRSSFHGYNLRGWVWRVAHNLGLNLQMAARRKEVRDELALQEVANSLFDPGPNPEQVVVWRQCELRVAGAIRKLSDRDRQCIHLRARGLGYRQIASVLRIGRSTVADTLVRATALLRSYGRL
jgi:RNA polymerase sigma-70 factor, ECF subfamily